MSELQTNVLYYGDNLEILRRYIPDASVDLIYLDPPFNSNRDYNVIFRDESGNRSDAQLLAFEDTWHWGPSAESTYRYLTNTAHHEGRVPDKVSTIVAALRSGIGSNQMMAYLVEMAVRLVELHRVLKPTGSLYLHCDAVASHYLKLLLDGVLGPERFRSEVIWKRTSSHGNVSSGYGDVTDQILYYSKGPRPVWNQVYVAYSDRHVETKFTGVDPDGRRWTTSDLRNPGYRPNLIYEYKGYQPSKRVGSVAGEDGAVRPPGPPLFSSDEGRRPHSPEEVSRRVAWRTNSEPLGRHPPDQLSSPRASRVADAKARRPSGAHHRGIIEPGRRDS